MKILCCCYPLLNSLSLCFYFTIASSRFLYTCNLTNRNRPEDFLVQKESSLVCSASVTMPWVGRPPFLHLPLGTRINKGFADPFLQVFSRIFWKRLFWRWFLACSQFVHICRRSKGNFSLSAAPIITDFFRFHKQIISHYCDHYLRSHHPPAVCFRTGVHDPGIWLPLSSRVTALENRWHLSERSELCRRFSALSSLPGG